MTEHYMTEDELCRREATDDERRRLEADHPAKTACREFVDTLFRLCRPKRGALETRRDRERAAAWVNMAERFYVFCDLYEGAPIEFEQNAFGLLLQIMKASVDVGKFLAPDMPDKIGRESQQKRAPRRFAVLVHDLMIYLEAQDRISLAAGQEPKPVKASDAAKIRPDILEQVGVPRDAAANVWPTRNMLAKALRVIRKQSF